MMLVNLHVYMSDRDKLDEWCKDRECMPADVIEHLIDRYLDELDCEYPRSDRDDTWGIKADMRYERNLDYKWGII